MKDFILSLNKEIIYSRVLCRIILVSSAVILITLGAFVRIPLPFTPVPITLQTFFVLLFAALLKPPFSFLSILIYLGLGLMGMPVFSLPYGGLKYFLGPTAGYLWGFLFSTVFVSKSMVSLKHNHNDFISIFLIIFFGELIILMCGSLWLRFFLNTTFKKAILLGFFPFLPFDLIKIWITTRLSLKLAPRIKRSSKNIYYL